LEELSEQQFRYVLQFQHKEKTLGQIPGVNDATIAALWGIDAVTYRQTRDRFDARAARAARDLLADPEFAACIDRLPFAPGDIVVGLGDSITDDDQSWLQILSHLLAQRRPQDEITVLNEGVSGDTTSQMISRFLDVALDEPDWILCLAGTNDARLHGQSPTKVLVSVEETSKNLRMLRHFGATQTTARWAWLTPATVIEKQIARDWFLSAFEMRWRNEDLAAIAAAVADVARAHGDPVVDLRAVFGLPADRKLLLPDGLHPSLHGQKAIVSALVHTLSDIQESDENPTKSFTEMTQRGTERQSSDEASA
jgi:acyl-CoA thioesterase-1